MLLTKQVEITINSRSGPYYENLGYTIPKREASEYCKRTYNKDTVYDYGKTIIINIEDVSKNSHSRVNVLCDYCQSNIMNMPYYKYNEIMDKDGKCCCKNCVKEKIKEHNVEKYGVQWTAQLPEVRERFKQTMTDRYGCDNPLKSESIKKKQQSTILSKYGCLNVSQSSVIQSKKFQTMFENQTTAVSITQKYLHQLFGGILNYPLHNYCLDILLPNNIDFEYDGSGHRMNIYCGVISEEEFNRKEIIRNTYVSKQGYKIVRLIAKKDRIPYDDVLLDILQYANDYFLNNPDRSWINFDIDRGVIYNAYYKESSQGLPYDYGKLRKIKKEHLSSHSSPTPQTLSLSSAQ